MSGLGTVVGAIEGTLGLGHSPVAKEPEVVAHGKAKRGDEKAEAMKKAASPKKPKAALPKARDSKPQKVSRAKQASIHALAASAVTAKTKAVRHH